MVSRDDIKQVYVDTNLVYEWFSRLMRSEKREEPKIIKFFCEHKEIKKFVSIFTVAELIEKLLFKQDGIKEHMKNKEMVLSFLRSLMQMTGIQIIGFKEEDEGSIFVSSKIIEYTVICRSMKDAIHVSIAKQENLWFLTHDDEIGKLKPAYEKIITDTHLFRVFGK